MISINSTKPPKGFSLIEILFVFILVGVLATFTISNVGTNDDSIRFEATRSKLEAIRTAVLGNEASVDSEGKRLNFGYLGDVGNLPSSLSDLVSKPGGMNTWVYSSTYGFAAGWHGPYLAATLITGDKGFDRDGWGRLLSYTTVGTPSVSSLGSDNAPGGAKYAADIAMNFSSVSRLASVTGILEDYNARISGRTVELAFPAAGAITSTNVVTDANGYFRFQTVPFGVRSLRMKDTTVQMPRPIVVDRNNFVVPSSLLNMFGTLETVSYVAASLFKTNTNRNLFFSLASTYTTPVQLDAITVTWTGGGTVNLVKVNGSAQTVSFASGARIDLSADMILQGSSSQNSFEIDFSAAPTAATTMTLLLEWIQRTKTDTVTITV